MFWLLVPPVFVMVPMGVLFLSQVVQLSVSSTAYLALIVLVAYGLGAAVFYAAAKPPAEAVDCFIGTMPLEMNGDDSRQRRFAANAAARARQTARRI